MKSLAFLGISIVSILVIAQRRTKNITKQKRVKQDLVSALPGTLNLNQADLISLLSQLIGEAEKLQNFPPEFVPKEANVVRHLVEFLKPYSKENGGPLEVQVVSFAEGRENLIVRYMSDNKNAKNISLIGSHLDVVPADPNTWKRNPFKLTVEGDELYGRGTTDCLGHVAVITLFMKELAKLKPKLNNNVIVVFIAAEENTSIPGVGVDGLMKAGYLDSLKNGYMLWVDASDSQPCMGTAGALQWKLTAYGKRGHSGFPQNTINPIELVNNAMTAIQEQFYKAFPPHPDELKYKFATPSTIKPTQMSCATGSINQIPPTATICGDIRLTPFYDIKIVMDTVNKIVASINGNLAGLERISELGPSSRFHNVPGVTGSIEFEWLAKDDPKELEGIACNIDSPSFDSLVYAISKVRGQAIPYSINGSLPLVRRMQREGFDLQITGFGLSKTYHADNEYALLSDLIKGAQIMWLWVGTLENQSKF